MSSNLAIGLVIGASVGSALAGIKNVRNSLKLLSDDTVSHWKKASIYAGKSIASITSVATGFKGLSAMTVNLAQPAIEFESAMAGVKKVVDFDTPQQFKEMKEDILALTRTIPMAGEELAAIVASGGQAGIARENLLGFATDAAKMGVAFDMAAGDAGGAMATMANVLGKPIAEMAQLGDAINHLSDNANSKAADIVNVITRAGSDTRMLGLDANQTAAFASTFLSMGKAPELAAQAIKGMSSSFMQLKAGHATDELKQLGYTTESFANAMNEDAQGAITGFIAKVKQLPKDKQYPLLAKIFGKQYADDVLLLAQNTAEYNRQLDLLEQKDAGGNFAYLGSMEREFQSQAGTTQNQLKKLNSSFQEIFVKLGEALLPVINNVINAIKPVILTISDWISANGHIIESLVTVGAGLFALVGAGLTLNAAFNALMLPLVAVRGLIVTFSPLVMKLCLAFGYAIGYVFKFGRFLSGFLVKGVTLAAKAVLFLGRALLMNPIGLIITGIAVAAYLIYQYWEPIKAFFIILWATVKTAFAGFCNWVGGIWDGILGLWAAVWNGVSGWFTGLWGSFKSLFSGNFSALGEIILTFNPLSLFQSIFSGVLSWFGVDLPASFSGFGQNIIDGLINGIKNAWEGAKEIVSNLGSSIKNWFAEKLGIHSPSRVFKGFGENVVQGLSIGVDGESAVAIQSVGNVADNMQKAMPKTLNTPTFNPLQMAVDIAANTADLPKAMPKKLDVPTLNPLQMAVDIAANTANLPKTIPQKIETPTLNPLQMAVDIAANTANLPKTIPQKIETPTLNPLQMAVDVAANTAGIAPKVTKPTQNAVKKMKVSPVQPPLPQVAKAVKPTLPPVVDAVPVVQNPAPVPAPMPTMQPLENAPAQQGFWGNLWDSIKGIGASMGDWMQGFDLTNAFKFGSQLLGQSLNLPNLPNLFQQNDSDLRTPSFNPNAQPMALPRLQRPTEPQGDTQTTAINGGITVNFNPTIQVNGNQEKNGILNDIQQGLNMSLTEFERLLDRVLDQRQRRAY
ncbi:phage tail tape measure protein [Lonepinella koalarum]|uniref:TP901 family phage tail tape measure protein n=1 Tax=Lonepinella koalarum TaxID=53417 RepID=A0A4V2PT27_9PAST|nr:phage tail tape measure protein [Lonepinella koalarum]MDH2927358.1 hypothetical protein [Lonepinella koalarum]TCK64911.1 TP901 family phage tail tape measure protein [Lonepinella koalarum]TFJ88831.1 phage tail tape measure protein [Lonepinella koalarum]